MGRINNVTKWLVSNVNFLFSTTALVSMGFVIFGLSSKWGSLDRGFFLGGGLIALFFWFLLFLISVLGCIGVTRQTKRAGCWTGRRILALYQAILVLAIVGEVWLVTRMLVYLREFEEANLSLSTEAPLAYEGIEADVALRFNEFFFSGTSSCADAKYLFFWSFVDDHCRGAVDSASCLGCGDYSITMCVADEYSCLVLGDTAKCAYELCRGGVLSYLITYLRPVGTYMLAFTVFQFFLMFLNCLLICFTEKDSLETILMKTGTISRPDFDPRTVEP